VSIHISIDGDNAEMVLYELKRLTAALHASTYTFDNVPIGTACEKRVIINTADAGHIEPVVTEAPAEKKTRQRKSKDAPAVSIPSIDNETIAEVKALAAEGEKQFEADRQAAISTGEERVGPEDSPEVAAQDAADEAAETAATKTTLTLDDVRNALGEYVKQYGMEVTHLDGPKVISMVCGEGKQKVSDVPEAKIAEVVAGIKEMTTKNPFGRAKVAA
jgi:hypothetical protein